MIDREVLKTYENILELENPNTNLSIIDKLLYYIEHEKSNDFLKTLLNLYNTSINDEYLFKVINVIKEQPEIKDALLDSFSNNQVASKTALLDAVDKLDILTEDSTVVIWGSWYGSILIPKLAPKVKRVVCIDLDNSPLQIAKNRLFNEYNNVEYICDDIFKSYRDLYLEANLIINTSCEHMPSMKEWKWFNTGAQEHDIDKTAFRTPKLPNNCYFVFQSNNMDYIEDHSNCVYSLEEFKSQLPNRAKVLHDEEVIDSRGTRFMLAGQFVPL